MRYREAGRAYRKQATTTRERYGSPRKRNLRRPSADDAGGQMAEGRRADTAAEDGGIFRPGGYELRASTRSQRAAHCPLHTKRRRFMSGPMDLNQVTRALKATTSQSLLSRPIFPRIEPQQRSSVMSDLVPASQETSRPRNVLWDALVDVFGYSPLLRGEQKLWGRVVSELAGAGATAVQVHVAARAYQERYPGIAFTPTALLKHWSQLLSTPAPVRRPSQAGRLLRIADDLEAAG